MGLGSISRGGNTYCTQCNCSLVYRYRIDYFRPNNLHRPSLMLTARAGVASMWKCKSIFVLMDRYDINQYLLSAGELWSFVVTAPGAGPRTRPPMSNARWTRLWRTEQLPARAIPCSTPSIPLSVPLQSGAVLPREVCWICYRGIGSAVPAVIRKIRRSKT